VKFLTRRDEMMKISLCSLYTTHNFSYNAHYYLDSIMLSSARVLISRVAVVRATSNLGLSSSSSLSLKSVGTFPTRFFGAGSTFLDRTEVTDRIVGVIKNFDKVDASKVTPESKFAEDLGLDSLDAVEVVMAIEDEFAVEIPDAEADKMASVTDAVEYIVGHPMAK
jgi:NADH dehydrogenase (ubiquinone) 1 alpha/beta subcomplex 1, acyl-carrier protein